MPTYTQSQDEFKVDAVDPVHINPSILEGVNLVSGILGPRSAVPIARFAPYYVVNSSISGDPAIPNTLTCNPGVVAASPSPSYTFQWQSAGMDLIGEINSTLVTDGTMDATNITCDVEAVNFLGVAYSTSNAIYVQIIEPVCMEEHVFAAITGLGQANMQNLLNFRGAVIVGLSIDDYQSMYTSMGYTVEGIGIEDTVTSSLLDIYAIELP